MARLPQAPYLGATVRGKLAQLYFRPGAEAALALVDNGTEIGTPMRISPANFDSLHKREALNRSVVCQCDGEGLWLLQVEADTR